MQIAFFGDVVNVGMNKEISIEALAEYIASYLGKEILIKTSDKRVRPSNSEVDRLMCDKFKITGAYILETKIYT